ncbi:beta-1,3-galactosyltransferase 5-like [Haliotis rufescens]|uniref:beta-1,3-galactosyltransferase 5-like n=1 Tax=Haliotis rufescens TaxID=6454 RepID=UPI001EAFF9B5|nr:beta-1,3-galactosyltransferase 5-like [Haliotis rufescens]XP_046329757.1 beta-1,3-galactosyltransferase 5-like [Haliotis rufescens]
MMGLRLLSVRNALSTSGQWRLLSNKRVLLVCVLFIWFVMLMFRSSPEQHDSEIKLLHRQVVRALNQNNFYGHADIYKGMWYFEPRDRMVTPLEFPFILDGAKVCEPNGKPLLLVAVMSLHNKTEQRQAIRRTYGRTAKGRSWPGKKLFGPVKLAFFFGVSNSSRENSIIEQEAKLHQDIVQVNFTESYFNLTYKVLMAIKWAKIYCPKTSFIMKVDEDSFVDIPRMTDILLSVNMTNQIYGHFHYADPVERAGKMKVAKDAYPIERYPPHVKGNIYVMPTLLATRIMLLSQFLPYVNMEDAHITGTLAKILDVRHHDIPTDQYNPYGGPDVCDFALSRKIAAQQVNASVAYQIWDAIEDPTLCIK